MARRSTCFFFVSCTKACISPVLTHKSIFFQFIRRVIIILDVEIIAPGSKVGCKIGNPINMSKPETETTKPETAVSTTSYHHNSKYLT